MPELSKNDEDLLAEAFHGGAEEVHSVAYCPICCRRYRGSEYFCTEHKLPLVPIHLEGVDPLLGYSLDQRYVLTRLAGKGGMGVVYQAIGLRLGEDLAIKIPHTYLQEDPKNRLRLHREVRATAKVRHRNVVDIVDFGIDKELGLFLVMELLGGRSLSDLLLEKGQLNMQEALPIVIQICAGLAETHRLGMIHRDLKPSNVHVLPDNTVKLLDFGLAKPYRGDDTMQFETLTTVGTVFGTPWYMSPEQVGLKPVDPRSDIYCLGVLFYRMILGRLPFEGKNALDVMQAHSTKAVPLPHLVADFELHPGIELLLLKMLHKDPRRRYQSMGELSDDFYRIASDLHIDLHGFQTDEAEEISTERELASPGDNSQTIRLDYGKYYDQGGLFPEVAEFLRSRIGEIVKEVSERLRETIPRYRDQDAAALMAAMEQTVSAALSAVDSDPQEDLPQPLVELFESRFQESQNASGAICACFIALSVARSHLENLAHGDIERLSALQEFLDRRTLPFFVKLIALASSGDQRVMATLNQVLAKQNDELHNLRHDIAGQLQKATAHVAELERLKAQVTDSISSGVMLIDSETRQVLLFNRSMEKLTGVSSGDALGQSIDDLLHFVEGIPRDEFLQQLRLHGEVGLRKLEIKTANNEMRTIFVRGQQFHFSDEKRRGTLFLVEDITAHDRIVASFSRYVPRSVFDRVLSRPDSVEATTRSDERLVVAIAFKNFDSLQQHTSPTEQTQILSDFVNILSRHSQTAGGMIKDLRPGGALLALPSMPTIISKLVESAQGLFDEIGKIPCPDGLAGMRLEASIGIHVGIVHDCHFGGERKMAFAALGDGPRLAWSLQRTAEPGTILASPAVADLLEGRAFYNSQPLAEGSEITEGYVIVDDRAETRQTR